MKRVTKLLVVLALALGVTSCDTDETVIKETLQEYVEGTWSMQVGDRYSCPYVWNIEGSEVEETIYTGPTCGDVVYNQTSSINVDKTTNTLTLTRNGKVTNFYVEVSSGDRLVLVKLVPDLSDYRLTFTRQ